MTEEIDIPTWKWDVINVDFITGLPHTRRQHNSIWVTADRMTMSSRFYAFKTIYSAEDYANIYITEIVRFHGVSLSIISDRDPQLTSHFWKSFQNGFGTQVNLSTTFHPQTDAQADRTIKTLEDMLRSYVIDIKGSWDDHFLLLSSPTTITTIPAFRWPLMRLYMGVDVDIMLVSLKQVKQL